MNQFSTQTIVNADIFTSEVGLLKVAKVGNFKASDVTSCYKHVASAGVHEVATLTIPAGDVTKTYRLHVKLKLDGENVSEFANSLTRNDKIMEFEVKGSATAADMATAAVKAVKLYNLNSQNPKFTATAAAGVITFTAASDSVRFEECSWQELVFDSPTGYDSSKDLAAAVITTHGKLGFGDTRWIIKNLQLPTIANTNWTALSQDERPVPGALYDQYTIHMSVNRGELTGSGAVGQELVSKTTHVLYVRLDLVAGLDTDLGTATIDVTTVA